MKYLLLAVVSVALILPGCTSAELAAARARLIEQEADLITMAEDLQAQEEDLLLLQAAGTPVAEELREVQRQQEEIAGQLDVYRATINSLPEEGQGFDWMRAGEEVLRVLGGAGLALLGVRGLPNRLFGIDDKTPSA